MLNININSGEEQSLLLDINNDNNSGNDNHPRLRRLKKCFKREYNQDNWDIENCIILFICVLTLISTVVIVVKCLNGLYNSSTN